MRKGNKLIQEGKVPKKRTLNTQVLNDIVNGYYLDGIEAGYKAGYDYGYEVGKKDYDQNNKQFDLGYKSGIENGYQQGLEDGRKQSVAIDGDKRYWDGYHAAQKDDQLIYIQMYTNGLDDAWAAARKLFSDMSEKEIEAIFPNEWNNGGFRALIELKPKEAIEKIREYEEKQERDCDTCAHNARPWWSEDCDGCTGNNNHYVRTDDSTRGRRGEKKHDK